MEEKTKADRLGRCMLKMQLPRITSPVTLEHFNEKVFVAKRYVCERLLVLLASLRLAILK